MTSPTDITRSWLFRRVYPATVAAACWLVVATSRVEPSLWVVHGQVASFALLGYGALMAVFACSGPMGERAHGVAAALAVLAALGRGGGFVELVVEAGHWDLTGAVAERVVILLSLLLWHQAASFDHGRRIVLAEE